MDAGSLLEALDIMFTVITIGLVVITGTFIVPRVLYANVFFTVFVALWASGLIAAKRLNFWGQRLGGLDQMSSMKKIHLFEIATSLELFILLIHRANRASLQDVLREVIKLARPSAPFFLVGLAITGYGMVVFFAGGSPTVFFLGDFGVYIIIIGLMVIIAGRERARAQGDDAGFMAGANLIVYILVILLANYFTGKWRTVETDSSFYYYYV